MENPAAISAEFVQIKQMKSKPVMQLIFELPIEHAEQVTRALGWPRPDTSVWCGIAKLNEQLMEETNEKEQ